MSDKLQDFYRTVQVGLQNHIHRVLSEVEPLVGEAEASIGDLSFCFGSVFASVLFELIRESNENMTEDEKNLLSEMVEPFMAGFNGKLELLVAPDAAKIEMIKQ